MNWQPITTAPRDGSNIMIRFGQDGVSQAKYIAGLPFPWQFIDTNDGITWLINHAKDAPGGPSHWMPMPAASTAPQAPVREVPGWISVDDRLPKEETDVIALRFGNPRIAAIFVEVESYEEGGRRIRYWDDPTNDGQGWEWDEITHWMPLPAAPVQQEGEKP